MFTQGDYDIRCEWGAAGIDQLVPSSDAIIIVDVLSFSTSVDIATANGALIYPFRWRDDTAVAFARSIGALLAGRSRASLDEYSLAPTSLLNIPRGTRLVLPSPNGSTLSLATGEVRTLAGCLRNARAVARGALDVGPRVSVIPAGERWEDGTLRPCVEDLIGAGAVIHYLEGSKSPEAEAAEAAFLHFRDNLSECLRRCGSGRELIALDQERDVDLAVALNESDCVPLLTNGAYVRHGS
ncbi:MAG TPA: 2-phosphosulfolactate phosphatase [Chloroflexia bacterium]|nr:2-phosphosulfolactate phosphatase [Chloroflexia bacterium]